MLFSQISNINFDYAASDEKLIANSERINDIISTENVASKKIKALWDCNWKVAWGPALNYFPKKGNTCHADNSMFVVQGTDSITNKKVYVVAIAGTNELSKFEMRSEDIAVTKVALWNKSNPTQGEISEGSMTGLEKVLGDFTYGAKSTLMDFFNKEVKQHGTANMEIMTCGHSLGGALSPLVALKIKETYQDILVSTYPTAGPTSGEAKFAQYLAATLGEDNYISVINTNDIVPMAWEHETLAMIPDVYDKPESNNTKMNSKMEIALKVIAKEIELKKIDYTRIAKSQEYRFTGSLTKPECPKNENGCDLFMLEAMYQHSTPYFNEFFNGEEEFVNEFRTLVYEDKPIGAK